MQRIEPSGLSKLRLRSAAVHVLPARIVNSEICDEKFFWENDTLQSFGQNFAIAAGTLLEFATQGVKSFLVVGEVTVWNSSPENVVRNNVIPFFIGIQYYAREDPQFLEVKILLDLLFLRLGSIDLVSCGV
jgi:hypothetical protein